MTGMGDYGGDCDDEARLIRFAREAEQGIHTCENCNHNESHYPGQVCDAEGSDFPATVTRVSDDGRQKGIKSTLIPYDEEGKQRNCPKWVLRTKTQADVARERTRKFFKMCEEDKKKHCLCSQCKSKTCLEKGSFEFP